MESLREHCNKLTCQLNEIKNKLTSTISTQTENIEVNDNKHEKLNKHTQVIQNREKRTYDSNRDSRNSCVLKYGMR